jgi:soluble lytic murein transglycosylase
VRFRAGWLLSCCLLPVVTGLLSAALSHASAITLSTARAQYGDAMQAIDKGQWTEYEQLRPGLDEYPLAVYLDYRQMTRRVDKVRPVEAKRFISLSEDTPLPNRFLAVYLRNAGKSGRWEDFLAVMPDEPNSIDLKCYYFRARLARGDQLAAWEGAERLWVHGESRPKACDPLFNAWLKAGELSDEVVWARLLKAFDARESSLMKYVASKGSVDLQPWSDRLLAVYRKPDQIRRQQLPSEDARSAQVVTHGLARLARYNTELALDFWDSYQDELQFDDEQQRQVEYAITRNALLSQTAPLKLWLVNALGRLEDDKLVEMRLRWALAEQDWPALEATLPLLSEERRGDSGWRYWGAVALENRGKREEARTVFLELAGERGYYGFLSADRLGLAYAFNHQPLQLDAALPAPLQQLPAVRRIGELHFHDEPNLAHSEWHKVLQDRHDTSEQQQLAQLAYQQGWHRMAIDAANRAKAWDSLDLRFPMPYQDVFSRHGGVRQVPSTELMAIARRESAFFPEVRSPVGARGLMQVMPATGRQVASSLGVPHRSADLYEVEHNVLLGSAYYRQLLDRYDGNRVFALAAYNAGPHRVDRWRHKAGEQVPVEVWIETIPYRETRNYVQAVLSYNVVFNYLRGEERSMLSQAELTAGY